MFLFIHHLKHFDEWKEKKREKRNSRSLLNRIELEVHVELRFRSVDSLMGDFATFQIEPSTVPCIDSR